MSGTSRIALLALLCHASVAGAQPDAARPDEAPDPDPAPDAGPPAPADEIERPKLVVDSPPRYPPAAWEAQLEADVTVLLTVDLEGNVTDVEVVEPAGHGFDEQALLAGRKLRFSPARINGQPTAVQIRYTFRFRVPEKQTVARPPPAPDGPPADPRKPVTIRGTVYERGKGKRLPNVEVYVLDRDEVVLTDDKGRFAVTGPPGAYAITIRPPGFYPFEAIERAEEGQTLDVEYYVRRHRRARYSTIVWGTEGRAEVARTSLVEDEIRTVAGTLGDPIRVAMLLPGVSSSVSGLGYPIIRGSLPGDSYYDIDGIRVPMLYHLLFGPAVVHPRFVDEIIFQPGGYSAEFGRFPGGRIGATTARVDDEPLWAADLSIVETSLFRSQRVGAEGEMVAAVRYGTLGYIIEGLAANTVFRYWDYQTRGAYRLPNGGKLTLTLIGASDTVGDSDPDTGEENVLRIGFHTADLRYRQAFGKSWVKAGVQVADEFFDAPEDEGDPGPADDPVDADMQSFRPYLELGYASGDVDVRAGGDAMYQDFGLVITDDARFFSAEDGWTLGVWSALEWKIGDLLVNPSVRLDHYRYTTLLEDQRETSVDPRLSAVYDVSSSLRIKGSVGQYSGPARFSFAEPPIVFGPIPAFEGPGLQRGLAHTLQVQAGVETKLPGDLELVVTGFVHDSEYPVDFSLLDKELLPDLTPCDGDSGPSFTQPFGIDARSYGAEFLLRRRLGGSVFGWVSYAASRSERNIPDVGTIPFDFDQAHVFNGVVSWEVGRNWTLGSVLHYNTGRPYTPFEIDRCGGGGFPYFEERRGDPNSDRLPNYWRLDVRIQKREVFDTWFFDFYIDFFNAAFRFETIGYDVNFDTGEREPEKVPLFIPMIGIRGEF